MLATTYAIATKLIQPKKSNLHTSPPQNYHFPPLTHSGENQPHPICTNVKKATWREREREVYPFSPTVFIVVGFIFDILKSQTLKNYQFLRLKVLPSEQPINIYNS